MASGAALASLDLAKQKNCLSCHSVDTRLVGPAYKDVAKKYAGQKDAEDKLVQKVLKGGSGTWGTGTTNWTDVNGTTNQAWTNSFAVFQGTAGTVTVNGAQTITGMQFVTDGYSLQNGTAGSLNLVNG